MEYKEDARNLPEGYYNLPFAVMTLDTDRDFFQGVSMCKSCQCNSCRGGCRSCRRNVPDENIDSGKIDLEKMFYEISMN